MRRKLGELCNSPWDEMILKTSENLELKAVRSAGRALFKVVLDSVNRKTSNPDFCLTEKSESGFSVEWKKTDPDFQLTEKAEIRIFISSKK